MIISFLMWIYKIHGDRFFKFPEKTVLFKFDKTRMLQYNVAKSKPAHKKYEEIMMRHKKIISALIVAIAAPVIAYFVSEDIRCMRYLKDPDEIRHKEVQSIDMSEKDRIKDFDTLWKVVSEGIPAVYAYPDAFGYDIRKSEERYREAVRNAVDDTE